MEIIGKSGIYAIMNIANKQMYIGSAVNIGRRFRRHRSDLNLKRHHSQHLQNSWNKHGADMFEFNVVEYVEDINKLISAEQKWIDFFKPEYNKSQIAGYGTQIGLKRTEAQKEKQRIARSKQVISQEHLEKLWEGRKNSPPPTLGKKWSEESKANFSFIKKAEYASGKVHHRKGSTNSEYQKQRAIEASVKPVLQYSKGGEFIKEWQSAAEVEKELNINRVTVGNVCREIQKTAGGYVWKFKNPEDKKTSTKTRKPRATPVSVYKGKPILQYTLDGELIGEFNGAIDIQDKLGINNVTVGRCANGKQKTAGGFIWKFKGWETIN